jgi:hypothetical protein
LVETQLARAAE